MSSSSLPKISHRRVPEAKELHRGCQENASLNERSDSQGEEGMERMRTKLRCIYKVLPEHQPGEQLEGRGGLAMRCFDTAVPT